MFSRFLALVLPSSLPVDQSVALPLTCWLLGQGSSTLYSGSFCSLFWSLSPGFYLFIYCFVILMDSASPLGYCSFLLPFFLRRFSLYSLLWFFFVSSVACYGIFCSCFWFRFSFLIVCCLFWKFLILFWFLILLLNCLLVIREDSTLYFLV